MARQRQHTSPTMATTRGVLLGWLLIVISFAGIAGASSQNDHVRQRRVQEEFVTGNDETESGNKDSSDDKPSTVAVIFGFLIALLGVLIASVHGYFFIKNRLRERKKRRMEAQVKVASPSRRQMTPFVGNNHNNNNYDGDNSSSSSSSSVAIRSESSASTDVFAQELKIAAHTDDRVWKEFEENKMKLVEEGRVVGGYANDNDEDSMEMILSGDSTTMVVLPNNPNDDGFVRSAPPSRTTPVAAGISTVSSVDRYSPYGSEDDEELPRAPPGTQLAAPRITGRHQLMPASPQKHSARRMQGSPEKVAALRRRDGVVVDQVSRSAPPRARERPPISPTRPGGQRPIQRQTRVEGIHRVEGLHLAESNEKEQGDRFRVPKASLRDSSSNDISDTEQLVAADILREFRQHTNKHAGPDIDDGSSFHKHDNDSVHSEIELMKSLTPSQEEHLVRHAPFSHGRMAASQPLPTRRPLTVSNIASSPNETRSIQNIPETSPIPHASPSLEIEGIGGILNPYGFPSDETSHSGDSSGSLPTNDIVKELEVLKTFVTNYEKRRERHLDRQPDSELKKPAALSSLPLTSAETNKHGSDSAKARRGLRGRNESPTNRESRHRPYFLRRSGPPATGEDTGDERNIPHTWSTDSTTGDSSDPLESEPGTNVETSASIGEKLRRLERISATIDSSETLSDKLKRLERISAELDTDSDTEEQYVSTGGTFSLLRSSDDRSSGDNYRPPAPELSDGESSSESDKQAHVDTQPAQRWVPAKETKNVRFDEQANSLKHFNAEIHGAFSPPSHDDTTSSDEEDIDPHGRYDVESTSSEESWEIPSHEGFDVLRLGITPFSVQSPPDPSRAQPKAVDANRNEPRVSKIPAPTNHEVHTRPSTFVAKMSDTTKPQKDVQVGGLTMQSPSKRQSRIPAPGKTRSLSSPNPTGPQVAQAPAERNVSTSKKMPIQEILFSPTNVDNGQEKTGESRKWGNNETGDNTGTVGSKFEQNRDSESGGETAAQVPKSTATPPPTSPRRKDSNNNKRFSNIVSMFESKPKNSIYPPNESWQYSY